MEIVHIAILLVIVVLLVLVVNRHMSKYTKDTDYHPVRTGIYTGDFRGKLPPRKNENREDQSLDPNPFIFTI